MALFRVIIAAITALLTSFLAINPIDFDGLMPWLNGAATAPSPSPVFQRVFPPRERFTFGSYQTSSGAWRHPDLPPPAPHHTTVSFEQPYGDLLTTTPLTAVPQPPPPPPKFEALLHDFLLLLAEVNLRLTLLFNNFLLANPPVILFTKQEIEMRYLGARLDARARKFLRFQLLRSQRRLRLQKSLLNKVRWHQHVPAVAKAPSPPPTPAAPATPVAPFFTSSIFVTADMEPVAALRPELLPRKSSIYAKTVELEEQLAFTNQLLGALAADQGPYVKSLEVKIQDLEQGAGLLQARILTLMEVAYPPSPPSPPPPSSPSPPSSPKPSSTAVVPPPLPVAAAPLATSPPPPSPPLPPPQGPNNRPTAPTYRPPHGQPRQQPRQQRQNWQNQPRRPQQETAPRPPRRQSRQNHQQQQAPHQPGDVFDMESYERWRLDFERRKREGRGGDS